MSKKRKEEEKIFMKVSNSRKLYIPIYFMILVLVGVIIFIKYNGLMLNNSILILVGLFILFSIKFTELHRFSNSYQINEHSFVHKRGIFSKKIRNMDFLAISSIEVEQNFWQRLLGYGDVSIRLYSGETDNLVKHINNPAKFARFLRERIYLKRKEKPNW